MAWGSLLSATQLSLSGSYQTVQRSAADWEITLNPGESAVVTLNYSRDATTPTEDCQVLIQRTADGTTYEGDELAPMVWLDEDDADGSNDVILTITVSHVWGFRIRARLRDDDDTAGGDDTATLDVDIVKNGISV